MSQPVLFLVDDDPGVVQALKDDLGRRFDGDFCVLGTSLTPYSVGHGVGLRACELPTIYRADRMGRDQVLQEGMVISLEPETGVEVDGRLTILKVEDNYVVEEGGLRRLTDAQYTVFDV